MPQRTSRQRRAVPSPLLFWPAAAAALLLARPAAAQFGGIGAVQPALGTDVRVGDLHQQLENYFQPGVPTTVRPAWIVTPSIEGDLGFTDNAYRSASPQKADVFVTIIPSVILSGDTSRLTVNLNYSPQITHYLSASSQNQVYQFFNGQALATIVPDLFFIDVRGSITQQSLTTGVRFNQNSVQSFNSQNDVETTSFAIMPYLERRIGGYGTARVSYSYESTSQSLPNNNLLNNGVNNAALNNNAFGSIGSLNTQRERAMFTSGENYGRFKDIVSAQAVQYDGSGTYQGAHRNEIFNELGFALTRSFTLLGGIGYQDIRYAGTPGVHINQPEYEFGVRYSPNPDTSITIAYGKHDGGNDLSLDAQVALTNRLRLIAQYSTGITTDLEQSQSQLGNTTVTPTGGLTSTGGAPIGTSSTGFSALQNGVYRLERFSATLLFLRDRDSYSFSINNDNRTSLTSGNTLIGNGIIPAGTKTTSTYASANWQHDLSPNLNSTVSAQYGITNSTSQFINGTASNQTTFSVTAALNRQFTESLSGSIRYTFIDQSGGPGVVATPFGNTLNGFNSFNTGSYTSNTIILSLRKTF